MGEREEAERKAYVNTSFYYLFIAILGFELRTSCLLSWHSAT
jgi:hypothetical protein